jgi:hypothetical protein
MDELWQRYRTFWTPVLIGLGVFLIGVIAVHVMTDDPEEASRALAQERAKLSRKVEPTGKQISEQKRLGDELKANVDAWAPRLDQGGDAKGDVIEIAVDQALRAAMLRGASKDEASNEAALARNYFDGDEVAARIAMRKFEKTRQERVDLLRTADPNVGFSRLLIDVWNEIRVRANQADVEMRADRLGFATVTSVTRATLPQRLLNLALVARVVNEAVASGMESIDLIQVDRPQPTAADEFLSEWWVEFIMTGPMPAARAVLALAVDPDQPIALGDTSLTTPRGRSALSGLVQLRMKSYSIRVQPDVDLRLGEEEDE